MRLRALLEHVDVLSVDAVPAALDRPVTHVTRDSREVRKDAVFVAIVGAKVDGHALVPGLDALAVVVEHPVAARPGVVVVRVVNAKRALAQLAAALHGFPGRAMAMIAVTGTNGKTTTTTAIEAALAARGWACGRIGTTGNSIAGVPRPTSFTTPEAPQLQALLAEMRDAGCKAVAMEASSIGLAQHRVDAIPFHVGVFTNLTQDHLDFHGTMDAYADAKARLFRELLRPAGGFPRAILCADDPAWTRMDPPTDRWTYGFSAGADLRIAQVAFGLSGLHLGIDTPFGHVAVNGRLIGRHNALNLTATLGVLLTLGLPLAEAAGAVGAVSGVPGRLEVVENDRGLLVVVDYAHSDDAMLNVIPTVRELVTGKLWVVFGCGGDRDRTKRPKMGAAAARLADELVVTSDNPRHESPQSIVDDVLAGIDRPAHVELDRAAAIRHAIRHARPGDAVMLLGKGHETYQQLGDDFVPFDDRVEARRALEEIR